MLGARGVRGADGRGGRMDSLVLELREDRAGAQTSRHDEREQGSASAAVVGHLRGCAGCRREASRTAQTLRPGESGARALQTL